MSETATTIGFFFKLETHFPIGQVHYFVGKMLLTGGGGRYIVYLIGNHHRQLSIRLPELEACLTR